MILLTTCKINTKLLLYGTVLQWIKNLFTGRTFCTRINHLLSEVVNLLSGVIQGSVIGPLMFLIYINDLVALLAQYGVKIKLFADDVKLYVKIVNQVDCDKLHQALSALHAWAADWQLGVSIDKCCVMCIGKGEITDLFHIGGIQLPVVFSCRDLGVTIRNDLSPSDHITDIVVRTHRRANSVHRCFISRDCFSFSACIFNICSSPARVQ